MLLISKYKASSRHRTCLTPTKSHKEVSSFCYQQECIGRQWLKIRQIINIRNLLLVLCRQMCIRYRWLMDNGVRTQITFLRSFRVRHRVWRSVRVGMEEPGAEEPTA